MAAITVVQCNFSPDEQPALATEGGELLIGNYDEAASDVLRPWEARATIWRG